MVRGRHEGSTGMVVKVFDSEGLAEVFSDTTQENMKVFIRDLEESTGVTHGLTKFGEQYVVCSFLLSPPLSPSLFHFLSKK